MELTVELSRVKVKAGKSAQVDEWMAFLQDHMADTLLTLEAEKMYVEAIFREQVEGAEYLYWFSVQGQGGTAVQDSSSYIDKKHLEYWKECIDSSYAMEDMDRQLVMIPQAIMAAIQAQESGH